MQTGILLERRSSPKVCEAQPGLTHYTLSKDKSVAGIDITPLHAKRYNKRSCFLLKDQTMVVFLMTTTAALSFYYHPELYGCKLTKSDYSMLYPCISKPLTFCFRNFDSFKCECRIMINTIHKKILTSRNLKLAATLT